VVVEVTRGDVWFDQESRSLARPWNPKLYTVVERSVIEPRPAKEE